jgi:putative cofactor-binding repeat protein
VTVPAGQTLTIEPGVTVNAQGYYRITVNGTLLAVGTTGQPISMTATDHATGWRGLRLLAADNATTLRHCVIEYAKGTGSYPEVRGGAIYVQNCSPTIAHNELRYCYSHNSNSNGTGAGITTETSDALIEDNYVHDNQADSGGGICITEYGSPVIRRNLLAYNTGYYAGGGMYFGARSSPTVENNLILHNSAAGWGGGGINSWTSYIYYSTYPTIRNNVIAWNTGPSGGSASGGGGLYCRYDRAVLSGNTIANNQAGQGGGIYALNYYAQAPLVSNGILWGNTATQGAQIYLYPQSGGSGIEVSYTDVQDGWAGTGNIAADPLFVAPASDDYHLQPGSPCTDAGDLAFQALPGESDIDGQRRIWDGNGDGQSRVDMGADEYGSFAYGDLNCDGSVSFGDINPFVLTLTNPAAYEATFPNCDLLNADINSDGTVNFGDINPFVALLTGS